MIYQGNIFARNSNRNPRHMNVIITFWWDMGGNGKDGAKNGPCETAVTVGDLNKIIKKVEFLQPRENPKKTQASGPNSKGQYTRSFDTKEFRGDLRLQITLKKNRNIEFTGTNYITAGGDANLVIPLVGGPKRISIGIVDVIVIIPLLRLLLISNFL